MKRSPFPGALLEAHKKALAKGKVGKESVAQEKAEMRAFKELKTLKKRKSKKTNR